MAAGVDALHQQGEGLVTGLRGSNPPSEAQGCENGGQRWNVMLGALSRGWQGEEGVDHHDFDGGANRREGNGLNTPRLCRQDLCTIRGAEQWRHEDAHGNGQHITKQTQRA